MLLKYIFKNFTRRKVRTLLMVFALIISTGLIVAMSATVETIRRSNVDLIASAVGRFDIAIGKRDTSSDPFVNVAGVSEAVLAAEPMVTGVYPRLQADIEMTVHTNVSGSGTMLAIDPAVDDIGFVDVVEGEYVLGNDRVAVFEATAQSLSIAVGDVVDVSYSFPFPREVGQPELAGVSQQRSTQRFTVVGIVRQDGVTDSGVRDGFMVGLDDVQDWLNLPGRAQTLIITIDPQVYESANAEVAALQVRDIVSNLQVALGDDYTYQMTKAATLDGAAQAFLAIQALINTYGLISLGVVGLLLHTLVMTNVQEQRRDMAILRILGGQRNLLFTLVIVEILLIGVIGVGVGVLVGQAITRYAVVPLIQFQFDQLEGVQATLTPTVTVSTILPAIISAFLILIISSLRPARDAAETKVMHAINPGVADNIQLEDISQLRERSPNGRLFFVGVLFMLIFVLIAGFQAIEAFGGPGLQVTFFLLFLGVMVLGLGFMFFITTVPFERLVLLVMNGIFPRLTYFARRNVGRGSMRNTLISLLVLFSGVLPSFLATQQAVTNADLETAVRLRQGAPLELNVFGFWNSEEQAERFRLKPSFLAEELTVVPGVGEVVGLTHGYGTTVRDTVGLRSASANVIGVGGQLDRVLYGDLIEFVEGDVGAFAEILADPNGIIISEGLATYLAVSVGDKVTLVGAGLDHEVPGRVVAIARRIPGFGNIGRSRNQAQFGSDVLMSLDGFQALKTEREANLPAPDAGIFERVLAKTTGDIPEVEITSELSERFSQEYSFWTRSVEVQLEFSIRDQRTQQVFLIVLTVISFTTAVFGVFAIIYVTIYARRIEIGMMKAMGMRRRELTGMLIVESIAMTLGAAMAGIAAGASMGYLSAYIERVLAGRPMVFAVDTTVMPFIVIMVVFASVLGATFSARRIVKKRAVEILRM